MTEPVQGSLVEVGLFAHHAEAEHRCAAVSAETRDGAHLNAQRVTSDLFFDQRAWRVIEAAPVAHATGARYTERLELIAGFADVRVDWLHQICRLSRISTADTVGHYPALIAVQADERRAAIDALDLLQTVTGRRWEAA